ncbi:MAG: RNA polymerase sigma factor [Gammaproteobacteria bacterium]
MSSPDTEASDRDLVARFLASRDEATFRELYRRHAPLMYRVAARQTAGSATRADDVVQEAWLRGITRLAEFRFESKLSTWLLAIALNIVREMQRPRAEVIPFESLAEELHTDPEPQILAEDELAPVLRELPAGYRAVLILHDLEGFTHTEIGAALGIATGTAKSQLSRARASARALIEAAAGGRQRRNS